MKPHRNNIAGPEPPALLRTAANPIAVGSRQIDDTPPDDDDNLLIRESPRRIYARIGREAKALEHMLKLPPAGHDLVLMMTGAWHGFDLLGAVIHLVSPAHIEKLDIATLGFNRRQATQLGKYIDLRQIRKCRFLVSTMFRNRKPKDYKALELVLTRRGQEIASRRNHAKLLLFQISDGRTFAAHGSLNLRRCNAYENIEISTDPSLHAFFAKFMDDAIEDARLYPSDEESEHTRL